jgi:septum formation protein
VTGRLVLASASPRRRALLEALGVRFDVADPGAEELTEGDPVQVVVDNALRKARAGRELAGGSGATVIGADTDVVIDGEILGKPADAEQARAMLDRLGGRQHEVHGGLAAIAPDGGERTAHVVTTVGFHRFEPAVIDAYVAAGAWRGFAGAYAIQGLGSMLVESVEGDLANVIGLPLEALIELLPGVLTERSF